MKRLRAGREKLTTLTEAGGTATRDARERLLKSFGRGRWHGHCSSWDCPDHVA